MPEPSPELWDLDRVRRAARGLPGLVQAALIQLCDDHERLREEYVRLAEAHAALAVGNAKFTKHYLARPRPGPPAVVCRHCADRGWL